MKEIKTDKAPKAVGPYSQAVCSNGVIWLSGQIALDENGLPIKDYAEASQKIFNSIEAILSEAGASLSDVLKTTVFLTDIKGFPLVNAEYEKRFKAPYPARSCVEVSALPKGSIMEIECIAKIK